MTKKSCALSQPLKYAGRGSNKIVPNLPRRIVFVPEDGMLGKTVLFTGASRGVGRARRSRWRVEGPRSSS